MTHKNTARIAIFSYLFSFLAPTLASADAVYSTSSDPVYQAFQSAIKNSVIRGTCKSVGIALDQLNQQSGNDYTKQNPNQKQGALDLQTALNRCMYLESDLVAERDYYSTQMTQLGLPATLSPSIDANALMLGNSQIAGQGGSKLETEDDVMNTISHQYSNILGSSNVSVSGGGPVAKNNGLRQNMANLKDSYNKISRWASGAGSPPGMKQAATDLGTAYKLINAIHIEMYKKEQANYSSIDQLASV